MKEPIYIRAPEGTRSRIETLRGRERPADFLRRTLEAGLQAVEAEVSQSPSQSSERPVKPKRQKVV